MRKYLSVEVEHTRYARFLSLEQSGEYRISLTTLADYQKRADVKVYLIHEKERTLLHVFQIDRLPKRHAGEPRIELRGKYDGKYDVQLTISVDGRHYSSKTLSLKKYLKKRTIWPWILVAILVLLAAGSWIFIRSCSGPPSESTAQMISGTEEETIATGQTSEVDEESPADKEPPEASEPQAPTQAQSPAETKKTNEDDVSDVSKEDEEDTETAGAGEASETTKTSTAAESDTESVGESIGGSETSAETSKEATETKIDEAPDLRQQVFFGPDSSRLTAEAQQKLSQFARELQNLPPEPDFQLRIVGHCALYGTEKGREELSYDRAQQVAEYLENSGWEPAHKPVIKGLAGQNPVTKDSEKQHLNRRVEISTIRPDSDTASHQGQ